MNDDISDQASRASGDDPGIEESGGQDTGRFGVPAMLGLSLVGWIGTVLLGAIAFGIVAEPGQTSDDLTGAELFAANLPFQLGMAAVALALASLVGSPRQFLGLDDIRARDLPIGLAIGGVAQFVVGLIYYPLTEVFDRDAEAAEDLVAQFSDSEIVLLVLMAGVLAPIVEELFFRGLLIGLVRRSSPAWLAVVLVAAVFAASHFQLFELFGLFLFGSLAGLLLVRSGRMSLAIATHMGFNGVSLIVLLADRF